jgi:hypothetical protein
MRVAWWGAVAVGALALAVTGLGCTCGGTAAADAGVPLAWPTGARLEVAATTSTTALLRWPQAQGPVVGYHLSVEGRGTSEVTGESALVEGLSAGQHLEASVLAFSSETETEALHAEVAAATPLQVADGDVSLDFCQANAFLKQGAVDVPCDTLSVLVGHVLTKDGAGVPGLTVTVLHHPEFGSATSQADGLYALAVPAGKWTVEVKAESFISAQRWAVAKARDFSHVDDVVVLRRDAKATAIGLPAGGFHQATPVRRAGPSHLRDAGAPESRADVRRWRLHGLPGQCAGGDDALRDGLDGEGGQGGEA